MGIGQFWYTLATLKNNLATLNRVGTPIPSLRISALRNNLIQSKNSFFLNGDGAISGHGRGSVDLEVLTNFGKEGPVKFFERVHLFGVLLLFC
jgi:hypothetical protein